MVAEEFVEVDSPVELVDSVVVDQSVLPERLVALPPVFQHFPLELFVQKSWDSTPVVSLPLSWHHPSLTAIVGFSQLSSTFASSSTAFRTEAGLKHCSPHTSDFPLGPFDQ